MKSSQSLRFSFHMLRKSGAAYFNGAARTIGGAVNALASPWMGKRINPDLNFSQSINPDLQHAESIWNNQSQPTAAQRLPSTPMAPTPAVAPHMAAPSMMGGPAGMPSMAKLSAMMGPPAIKPPSMPKPPGMGAMGMMTGPSLPPSANSLQKPIGAAHRTPPAMSTNRFGRGHSWFMGGGAGSGNGGVPSMSPTFKAPAGGSSVGPGSSAGTTGGGDSGGAGQK